MTKNILVVDDDFNDLNEMKTILEGAKFKVIAVTNGARALDAFNDDNGFNLILLDIQMPTLSGYDLLRLLREKNHRKIKIAFVSIVPKKEVDLSGANGFIQKPIQAKNFLTMVKNLLK